MTCLSEEYSAAAGGKSLLPELRKFLNSGTMNEKVDKYLSDGCMRCKLGGTPACKVNDWRAELIALREIVLSSGLTEEVKWGVPCYTINGKNVLVISAFKHFCSISFFKGALLSDPEGLLQAAGEHTQAARLIKFTEIGQILDRREILRTYIQEAIQLEKAGMKVEFRKDAGPVPAELQQKFAERPDLEEAFRTLTPGRQREYLLHFSQPQRIETRLGRIEKCIDKILSGEGLNEHYKRK